MENTEQKSVGISAVLLTLCAVVGTFLLYVTDYLNHNFELQSSIQELITEADIVSSRSAALLYIIYAVIALVLLIVGFIIYKIICKLCGCKIPDSKLLLSVGIGYSVSFLTGSFLLDLAPFLAVLLIGNALEILLVICLCFSELQKKVIPFALMRAVLVVLNLLAFKFM